MFGTVFAPILRFNSFFKTPTFPPFVDNFENRYFCRVCSEQRIGRLMLCNRSNRIRTFQIRLLNQQKYIFLLETVETFQKSKAYSILCKRLSRKYLLFMEVSIRLTSIFIYFLRFVLLFIKKSFVCWREHPSSIFLRYMSYLWFKSSRKKLFFWKYKVLKILLPWAVLQCSFHYLEVKECFTYFSTITLLLLLLVQFPFQVPKPYIYSWGPLSIPTPSPKATLPSVSLLLALSRVFLITISNARYS